MTKQSKLSALGHAAREYWKVYTAQVDLPEEEARTWLGLSQDVEETLASKIYELITSYADFEGIALESVSFAVSPTCPQPPVAVKWGNAQALLFPWLNLKEVTKEEFLHFCSDLFPDTLTVIVTPQFYSRDWGLVAQTARDVGIPVILVAPSDIDALAEYAWSITEMINYKVIRIILEGGVDADAAYSGWQIERFRQDIRKRRAKELLSLESVLASREDDPESWLDHPDAERLATTLTSSDFALIVGKSASGKTILALTVAGEFEKSDKRVWYVDIGNLTSKRAFSVGLSVFREVLRTQDEVFLVLDDLHTQASLSKPLVQFCTFLQKTSFGNRLKVIGICWPEFQQDYVGLVDGVHVLSVTASRMREALIHEFGRNLDAELVERIREQAGGDLFLLRLWLESSTESQIVDEIHLAERVWLARSRGLQGERAELHRLAFIAYLIGQYECDVPQSFLKSESGTSTSHIDELIRTKLLTRKGDLLSPPHRSFARLIANYLGQEGSVSAWLEAEGLARNKGAIFVRYLEAIDRSQIWSALKLIESGGAVGDSRSSQEHIKMILDIWNSADMLLRKMEEQQSEDPSWGRTLSSSFFACQAFSTVGQHSKAQGSIDFIRKCYYLSNGKMEIDLGQVSTVDDFEEIRKRMALEEKESDSPVRYGLETSDRIDIDLFHVNWLCGLALGAEAYVRTLGNGDLAELALAVENRMEEGGYFYPARVPWVSARVLMALSLCGRTIENSPVVAKVADWLLKQREKGGARSGACWLPGTDGWNSTLETTAMVVIALRSVGVDRRNQVLRQATGWIVEQKKDWIRAGNELDAAVALEAYLSVSGKWSEVRDQALYLAVWADAIALWRNATESAHRTQEQSCRAAQVAAFLIKAMWTTLRNDVPQLLVAFGIN